MFVGRESVATYAMLPVLPNPPELSFGVYSGEEAVWK